eukprot:CAMPEP_0196653442 /NCGR_PEP_ID=MMETSP1086-20130531/3069_1 /TAXON_ID=77921 /ORGANISM="Cyanoptyche  gloeocystis , Strain SAG4.97" /LENGTH=226 /DNA_ID=CAMNT_0041984643 /DNA_START=327 /DNA_END=1007 /DNA_ORIENTATION=+
MYHPPAAPHPILKHISIDLPTSWLGLIIGESGSGKTTLLEVLAGQAKATSGVIKAGDRTVNAKEMSDLTGMVFQFPERHFIAGSIMEELRFGHPEYTPEEVREVLQMVDLVDISWHRSPFALSGGQQRRLAIAVQLLRKPLLLLLDEPTAGLDWSMRENLVTLLGRIKQQQCMLVVTHDPGDLIEVADQCFRLSAGRLFPIPKENIHVFEHGVDSDLSDPLFEQGD